MRSASFQSLVLICLFLTGAQYVQANDKKIACIRAWLAQRPVATLPTALPFSVDVTAQKDFLWQGYGKIVYETPINEHQKVLEEGQKIYRIKQVIAIKDRKFKVEGILGCGNESCVYLVSEGDKKFVLKKMHRGVHSDGINIGLKGLSDYRRQGIPTIAWDTTLKSSGVLLSAYRAAIPLDKLKQIPGIDTNFVAEVEKQFQAMKDALPAGDLRTFIEHYNTAIDIESGQLFIFDFL